MVASALSVLMLLHVPMIWFNVSTQQSWENNILHLPDAGSLYGIFIVSILNNLIRVGSQTFGWISVLKLFMLRVLLVQSLICSRQL